MPQTQGPCEATQPIPSVSSSPTPAVSSSTPPPSSVTAERGMHSAGDPDIHPWHQFIHQCRSAVVTLHHNVQAVWSERFGAAWRLTDDPVYLLGRKYQLQAPDLSEEENKHTSEDEQVATQFTPTASGSPEEFFVSWSRVLRMTYRNGFAPMYRCVRAGSPGERGRYIRLVSDVGWGCMIRVGQMLLAEALSRHRACSQPAALPGAADILEWFLDDPSPARCPFSIFGFIRAAGGGEGWADRYEDEDAEVEMIDHSETSLPCENNSSLSSVRGSSGSAIARCADMHKLPGDWFGPTTISETIAALVEGKPDVRDTLAIYVNSDGIIYEDEVRALARVEAPSDDISCGDVEDGFSLVNHSPASSSSASPSATHSAVSQWERAVVVLLPLQLGIGKNVNDAYTSAILRYFELPSSLGAMGGRPRMAHFFAGRHARNLLYIDPHVVQAAALSPDGSFENGQAQVLSVEHLDASLSFGFYLRSDEDLAQLAAATKLIDEQEDHALVHVEATRPVSQFSPKDAWHISDKEDSFCHIGPPSPAAAPAVDPPESSCLDVANASAAPGSVSVGAAWSVLQG